MIIGKAYRLHAALRQNIDIIRGTTEIKLLIGFRVSIVDKRAFQIDKGQIIIRKVALHVTKWVAIILSDSANKAQIRIINGAVRSKSTITRQGNHVLLFLRFCLSWKYFGFRYYRGRNLRNRFRFLRCALLQGRFLLSACSQCDPQKNRKQKQNKQCFLHLFHGSILFL